VSTPSAYELWEQAGGDGDEYRRLMIEHGLLIPLKPGEKAEPLPCGWPRRRFGHAELAGEAGSEATPNDLREAR
jgi:hypothetical protein